MSTEIQLAEQAPPFGSKRKAAMAIYTPPFKFCRGYIHDSKGHMVADQDGLNGEVEKSVAARVRGWGRIGYMPNPEELQDEVGQMMADALTAYYAQSSELAALRADMAVYVLACSEQATEIEALKAENEALRKDAERLNHMESSGGDGIGSKCPSGEWWAVAYRNISASRFSSLRAAIDATMKPKGA